VSNELKPCPFCGCEAEVLTMGTSRVAMRIGCPDCGASLECGSTWLEAAQWNNRHDDQAETVERQGQMIVKQAEQIQRMEDNKIKLIGNLQQAIVALLEIADYADKEPFDMRDLKLIAIASDCLGMG